MQEITEKFLQIVSGDIEKLMIENQEGIDFSYHKINEGIKLSISIDLTPSSNGIVTDYSLSYPLEPKPDPALKHKVTLKRVINEQQQEFFDDIKSGKVKIDIHEAQTNIS